MSLELLRSDHCSIMTWSPLSLPRLCMSELFVLQSRVANEQKPSRRGYLIYIPTGRQPGISTTQHPSSSNLLTNDSRPIEIKPDVQVPCYSTDRWALTGLLVHPVPLRAWGRRLIWRWSYMEYNNPPTPLPIYRTLTLQTCEDLLKNIYTDMRTFWNISVYSSPRPRPKLARKHTVRGRSRRLIWVLACIESRDSLDKPLIPHHIEIFFTF